MTIDEAIEHAREKAKEQRYYANFERNGMMYQSCIKCAEEHEQLAEWLEELKEMRKNQGQIADFWYQEGISRELKLIFDKTEEIKNRYDNEDFAIIGILIKIQEIALEMAEYLKAGGNIELSKHSKSQGD
jgi:hypothetical protein